MPAKNTDPKKQAPKKKTTTKTSVKIFWYLFLGGLGSFLLVLVLAMTGVFGKLPSLKELENPTILQSSEVYAADGTLMGKYYLERGNRSNINYRDISPHVINALIATEDVRFYTHSGIDFRRTAKAIIALGKDGGGSTITQQLAKALLFEGQGSKNSIARVMEKVKEYIVANPTGISPLFYGGILLMLVGLCFKVGVAPFHFWTPDVYDGAPTVFTSFSFHPFEAVLQFLFFPLMIMVLPIHYGVLLTVLMIFTVSALINHSGVEIFKRPFLLKHVIGSSHHERHHQEFRTNFGLYHTWWDKWMKTESKTGEPNTQTPG